LEVLAIREAGAPTDQHHPIDERPRPNPANVAERVNQRRGEYGEALQITLSEVEREEHDGAAGGHPVVPWYYWEAAAIYRKLKRYDEESPSFRPQLRYSLQGLFKAVSIDVGRQRDLGGKILGGKISATARNGEDAGGRPP
jgi:hypothetical protein